MIEYIRKQDAIDALPQQILIQKSHMKEYARGHNGCKFDAEKAIKSLEPADVAPVVHGEWLNAIFDSKHYRCSICNYHISNLVRENYCPNCGAKMDREE